MLNFEDEVAVSPIPGLGLQAVRGFMPASSASAGGRQERAQQEAAPAASADELRRIRVEDKRIINGRTDVNQLVPFKYKWAWEKYLSACANHWMPQEINMSRDIATWKDPNGLTEDERRIIKRNLGFSSPPIRSPRTTSCSAPTATSPRRSAASTCCARRSKRPSIPTPTSTSSRAWAWTRARCSTPTTRFGSIRDKDEFLIPFIDTLTDPAFKTGTPEADQQLLKSLIVFACIMEGLFFYVGFAQILALGRQNKMTGAAEQYQYILRDESMHCNFGIDLINQIKMENPHLWTPAFREEIQGYMKTAVELEYRYAEDTMPRGVLGLNAPMFKEYLRYIANRRCQQIGVDQLYPGASNPFPWMSEMTDLKKERNFFETRVIEYQTGGALSWD